MYGRTYSREELDGKYAFKLTYAGLKIYGKGDLRIAFRELPDGRFGEYMRYSVKRERAE